jgi:hypothetical protein
MLLTFWCIAVVLVSVVLIGVPATWLLSGRRPLGERAWVAAPFLGLAVVVLALQNLVYLDVPLKHSTPFVWLGVVLGWLGLWRSRQLPVCLARCPWTVFAAAVLVYLIHGLGLLRIGAEYYIGRSAYDEIHYDMMAHFFIEEPIHTPLQTGAPAYMSTVLNLMLHRDRIGQSMLHGFFAVTTGSGAKSLFEPTILLSPALVVLAVYALCRRLRMRGRQALAAATLAGLLPALTLIHLEGFFSQALCAPLLLFLPVSVHTFSQRPTLRNLLCLALLVAAITSIYTEFLYICVGVLLLMLLVAAWRHPRARRLLTAAVVLPFSPVILNPGFAFDVLRVNARATGVSTIGAMHQWYPWALQAQGVSRLWLGDLVEACPNLWHVIRLFGLGVAALAYLGMLTVCLERLRTGGTGGQRNGAPTLLIAVVALALVPMMLLAWDYHYPYQFYKLLCSVSPLLVVGLALLILPCSVPGRSSKSVARTGRLPLAGKLFFGLLSFFAVAGTVDMVRKTTWREPTPRCLACTLLRLEGRQLQDTLESLRKQKLLIVGLPHVNGWISYFTRYNRAWFADPRIGNLDIQHFNDAGLLLPEGPSPLPRGFLLLTSTGNFRAGVLGEGERLWGNAVYELWRPGPGPWAIPLRHDGTALGTFDADSVFSLNHDGTTVEVLASSAGIVTLTGLFHPKTGPFLTPPVRLLVRTNYGHHSSLPMEDEAITLSVPMQAGKNRIMLTTVSEATARIAYQHVVQEIPWEVKGLQVQSFTATASSSSDTVGAH